MKLLFIHYRDLYSASSKLLLRSASDLCMAKKSSFQVIVECFGKNPGDQSLCYISLIHVKMKLKQNFHN